MTIATASLSDLEPLVPLFEAYRLFYRMESNPERAREFLRERLQKNDSVIYIARGSDQEEALVGFVQLYPLFSSTRMRRLWLLNDLFVIPSRRGQGFAKALIEQSKQLARETDASGLLLETERSNTIGNRLYPEVGFALDVDHNYYFWTVSDH